MKKFMLIIFLIAVALTLSCAVYKNDKCWISEEQYSEAKKYFNDTGSINLTIQHLEEKKWKRCEVNEAKYRLIKEYDLE